MLRKNVNAAQMLTQAQTAPLRTWGIQQSLHMFCALLGHGVTIRTDTECKCSKTGFDHKHRSGSHGNSLIIKSSGTITLDAIGLLYLVRAFIVNNTKYQALNDFCALAAMWKCATDQDQARNFCALAAMWKCARPRTSSHTATA